MANIHWIALFVLGMLSGSSFLFAEILLNHINVTTIVFLRIGITGVLMFMGLIVYYRGHIIWNGALFGISKNQWLALCLMAFFVTVGPFVFVVYGQQFVTGGVASILNATTAFQGMILASLFFANERLRLNRVIGVLMGIFGVIVAIGFNEIRNFDSQAMGGLFVIIGAFFMACGSVWGKLKLQTVPIIISAMAVNFIGALEMLPFVVTLHADQFSLVTGYVFTHIFLYAIFASVLAFPLYFYLINNAGSSFMTLNTIMIVPSAIVLEYIFLGVPLASNQLYGFMIIAMGLLLLDGRLLGIKKL